jgi:hypothetical protein
MHGLLREVMAATAAFYPLVEPARTPGQVSDLPHDGEKCRLGTGRIAAEGHDGDIVALRTTCGVSADIGQQELA